MPEFVLLRKTLRDLRNTTVGIGLACFATALLMILLYPQIAEEFAAIELPEYYEVFMGEASIGSPEGFIAGEFFGWIPIMVVVMAIISGTHAIAGEEANGTLDLLLAQPLARRRILFAKAAGMALAFAVMCGVSFPGILLGRLLVPEFDLAVGRMVAGVATMIALVWFFLGLSLLASAALPSRAAAATLVTSLAVGSYILTIVASLVDALADLRWLSPFSWADFPATMLHGVQWPGVTLLLAGALLFALVAALAFERRDIGAAAGPRLLRRLRRPPRNALAPSAAGRGGHHLPPR